MIELVKKIITKIVFYTKSAVRMFQSNSIGLLPANIAFFTLWSLIPIIILWDIVSKLLPSVSEITATGLVDRELVTSIGNTVDIDYSFGLDSVVFIVLVLYLSTKPFRSIIIASNYIYGINITKNFFSVYFKAFICALLLIVTYVVLLIISVLGDEIINIIREYVVDNAVIDRASEVRLPLIIIFLSIVLFTIYYLAPNEKITKKYFLPGTVFSVIGWLLATKVYSVYIERYADYQKVYSSYTNIIILMIWIYIISYILILGLVVNAAYYKEKCNEAIRETSTTV